MEQSQVNADNRNILSLPVELLVCIVSFLTNVRDKVKLRYVSQRFRSISETPSLWRKFFWPYYDHLEERCLSNVLKTCGRNIVELSFPHHVMPSKLVKFLQHCGNIKHLSLSHETKLSTEQLTKVLQSMVYLSVLNIRLSIPFSSLLQLTSRVEELTVYVKEGHADEWFDILHEWVVNINAPKNLNVVFNDHYLVRLKVDLLHSWSQWNMDMPATRTACLRFYAYETRYLPMNLSLSLPVFQLQYGRTTYSPIVKASKFGLLGLTTDSLLLTDCIYEGKAMHKVKLCSLPDGGLVNSTVSDLTFVTYFDIGIHSRHLQSGHLEQIALACPNLSWLNVRGNSGCLQSLQGLEVISRCCQNLQGLNLSYVPLGNVENQVKFWKILSSMKLTQLAVELCTLKPFRNTSKLIRCFQKCSSLLALEAYACCMEQCGDIDDDRRFLLSHFPSLRYLKLSSNQPQCVQEIITTCQGLKLLKFNTEQDLDLSSAYSNSLEQLCIRSEDTDVSDTFLDSVSTHGGLIHVVLCVNSVPSKGIAALVKNSPKLITCNIFTITEVYDSEGMNVNLKDFKATLKAKFSHRKLFTCGNLRLARNPTYSLHNLDECFEDTTSDFVLYNGETM